MVGDQHNWEILDENTQKGRKLRCRDCKNIEYEDEEFFDKYCGK